MMMVMRREGKNDAPLGSLLSRKSRLSRSSSATGVSMYLLIHRDNRTKRWEQLKSFVIQWPMTETMALSINLRSLRCCRPSSPLLLLQDGTDNITASEL